MKRNISVLSMALLLAVSGTAIATGNHTCQYGGTWPNCKPKPEPPKPDPQDPTQQQEQKQDQQQNQNQGQAQGQAQGQVATGGTGVGVGVGIGKGGDGGQGGAGGSVKDSGNSSNLNANLNNTTSDSTSQSDSDSVSISDISAGDIGSNSDASVGDTSSNSASSVGDTNSDSAAVSHSGGNILEGSDNVNKASTDNAGNSSVEIDTSNNSVNSYESQALFIPEVQTAAPALVASPTLVVDRGMCGPRMSKRQERAYATYVGIVKKSKIDIGYDDELTPADEPYRYWTDPNGGRHVFGHQVVTYASVNGVAASRSLGLGGGETGGNWGNGGASSNSSVQRTILRVQLQECELPLVERAVPVWREPAPRIPRG